MSAESDARNLARLRERRDIPHPFGVVLAPAEFDLLLRIADERDQLARDLCEEQQGRGRRPIERCAACRWEQGFGAVEITEHTCERGRHPIGEVRS